MPSSLCSPATSENGAEPKTYVPLVSRRSRASCHIVEGEEKQVLCQLRGRRCLIHRTNLRKCPDEAGRNYYEIGCKPLAANGKGGTDNPSYRESGRANENREKAQWITE